MCLTCKQLTDAISDSLSVVFCQIITRKQRRFQQRSLSCCCSLSFIKSNKFLFAVQTTTANSPSVVLKPVPGSVCRYQPQSSHLSITRELYKGQYIAQKHRLQILLFTIISEYNSDGHIILSVLFYPLFIRWFIIYNISHYTHTHYLYILNTDNLSLSSKYTF